MYQRKKKYKNNGFIKVYTVTRKYVQWYDDDDDDDEGSQCQQLL